MRSILGSTQRLVLRGVIGAQRANFYNCLHKRWDRRVIKEGRFAPKRKADGHVMYIWRQSLRRIFKLLFTLHGISIKMQYPISICNKWVEIVFPVMTQRILDKPFYSWEDWGDQAEF